MPQYFFDTSVGGVMHRDEEGHDAWDDEFARRLALDALPDLARDAMPGDDSDTFSVIVRNSLGAILYSATLTLKGVWRPVPTQIFRSAA